ncbi:DUF2207 domain-containing protein, partial [bacterium]|nr:DUF2207 domain-containing protein [bacterium]
MKYRIIFVLCVLVSSVVWGYYIKDFSDDIVIDRDGTITVTERITVDFEEEMRHGIYREIITKYTVKKGILKYKYFLQTKLLSVTDGEGSPLKYKLSHRGIYWKIRIGDPDKYVTGVQTYVIKYSVYGAINEFEDHFELWWEVTGHEWEVPIQ